MADLDPRTSEDAAVAWTRQLLQWLAWAERENQLWYETLVEQISMGLISCKEVQFYNQQAERLYYWEAWVWTVFDPVWTIMRQQVGIVIPFEPPLPKLIGSTYNVYGGKRLDAKFKVTVPCQPNGLADATQLDPYGLPAGCKQREPDPGGGAQPIVWSGSVIDVGGELGNPVVIVALVAIAAVGLAYVSNQGKQTIQSAAGTIDGSTIARINAQMQSRQLEQDRKRAEYITQCQRDTLARMGTLGQGLTAAQLAAIRKDCEAGALVAYPDREPHYASGLGLAGVLLALGVVGGVVGTVYLITRRDRGKGGRAAA